MILEYPLFFHPFRNGREDHLRSKVRLFIRIFGFINTILAFVKLFIFLGVLIREVYDVRLSFLLILPTIIIFTFVIFIFIAEPSPWLRVIFKSYAYLLILVIIAF